jgi:hypothetical protein
VQLLVCFVVGALLFLQMILPDLTFGRSSRDVGVGYEERSNGSSSIPKSLRGDMIARCGKWKPPFSRSTISFLERLVPMFIG